ncbi:F-box family protein [Theobroma cacao]|uniref:F-box family protein n=1 Tax=Theobroma cacao TaxID=3641 RepID=A0A061GAT0_THECC|nr:F-box family protein [Theobroma cacao]
MQLGANPSPVLRIFGSCNGLLAVCHSEQGVIALWNPSTRKCHYLPTPGDDIMDHDIVPRYWYSDNTVLGFGYDVCNSDYKVVKMLRSKTQNCFKVMVYSLKAKSWRIKDCPYGNPRDFIDGAYVNGALYWVGDEIGKISRGKLIFTFDLGTEEYYVIFEGDIRFRKEKCGYDGTIFIK